MREHIVSYMREKYSDVPLVLYGPFEAPIYKVQNMCRMRFVIKCRINKRTRDFIGELIREFSRGMVSGGGGRRLPIKSDKNLTVSVDINPSTV